MRLRHKILLIAAAAFAICLVGSAVTYLYTMAKLKNGLTYFQNQIVEGDGNVESLEIKYGDLSLQFPFGLRTEDLHIDISTTGSQQDVLLTAVYLGSQLKGFPSGLLKISARDIHLSSGNETKPLLSNQYKIRDIELRFVEYQAYASILKPEQSMRRVYGHLAEILDRGDTTGQLNLQGTVYFEFGKDQVFAQRFHTQASGNTTRIVLNREDLNLVAPQFASRLSTGDLDLVANHPMKAPRLLEIRRETEEKARELNWSQPNFPEDVYRHVLWSYLLTKEYGAEFAHFVTNAHETGSFNTEAEMTKDRQNNRVGIAYAEDKVPESLLLKKIRSDPRIQF